MVTATIGLLLTTGIGTALGWGAGRVRVAALTQDLLAMAMGVIVGTVATFLNARACLTLFMDGRGGIGAFWFDPFDPIVWSIALVAAVGLHYGFRGLDRGGHRRLASNHAALIGGIGALGAALAIVVTIARAID